MVLTLPVRDLVRATPRAHIVRLGLDGQAFEYQAGQAAFLQPHGTQIRRPFSIASSPEETATHGFLEFLIQTDIEGLAGFSLDLLRPGHLISVEGPLGSFTMPDHPTEHRFLFIAGGTGIAPLRSMLLHALAECAGRMSLVYSARMREDLAYREQFERLRTEGRIEFRDTLTRDGSAVLTGRFGRIDANGLKDLIDPGETVCFVCGPPALVSDIPPQLRRLGVRDDQIRMERW
jgi:NAD(P)H-flavin reductase